VDALRVADLAYIAAVIDTRGHIASRSVREAMLPLLAVSSPEVALLNWLGEITGTRPVTTSRSYGRAGCSEHCPDAHQHVTSISGRWSVTGVKATVVLFNVAPYLRVRAQDAADAMALGLSAGFKRATVQKMAALGWALPNYDTQRVGEPA
jgi:hypothetical protein